MKTIFGEFIKFLRNENELTLTQIAVKLNLYYAYLSKRDNLKVILIKTFAFKSKNFKPKTLHN